MLGVHVDVGVWIDASRRAENNLRIWRSEILSANQAPISYLANRKAVSKSAFQGYIGLIGCVPQGALKTKAKSADSVELIVDQPVVGGDVPGHDCFEAAKT